MKGLFKPLIICAILAICLSAYAIDVSEQLIDPAVTLTNSSKHPIEMMVYTDLPKHHKIIKDEVFLKPNQSMMRVKGIDYFAEKDSGSARDQRNKITVTVYDSNGHLLTSQTDIVKSYGIHAIKKNKSLMLHVDYQGKQSLSIRIVK